jgi:hypothetical protein
MTDFHKEREVKVWAERFKDAAGCDLVCLTLSPADVVVHTTLYFTQQQANEIIGAITGALRS